jgi:hypothetical protein
MNREQLRQLQRDLKALDLDPGPIDGIMGPKTRAAMYLFSVQYGTSLEAPDFARQVQRYLLLRRHPMQPPDSILRIAGDIENTKTLARDFAKKLYLQVHQTDFWPGDKPSVIARIKTNLYVSTRAVYEVHPVTAIIDHNYNDFIHIEVAWVSESRRTVTENGKTYHREAGIWTPEREALLEVAILYEVEQARAKGAELTIITHCQTYRARALDPDKEIAQAAYRIAKEHGLKLDFDWVRGSGQSAAKWYPEGCGKLG